MKSLIFFLVIALILFSCGRQRNTPVNVTTNRTDSTVALKFDPNGPTGAAEKKERIEQLINLTKQTMDSIDVAYASVRKNSRLIDLSPDEREDVNEALQQMNVAKELIVLQTQSEIIQQLRDKTNSLNAVIDHINKTSNKLNNIAATINKVSHIIEGTTNMLASAFSAGIIKPNCDMVQN